MAIFNSYVKLPEGIQVQQENVPFQLGPWVQHRESGHLLQHLEGTAAQLRPFAKPSTAPPRERYQSADALECCNKINKPQDPQVFLLNVSKFSFWPDFWPPKMLQNLC